MRIKIPPTTTTSRVGGISGSYAISKRKISATEPVAMPATGNDSAASINAQLSSDNNTSKTGAAVELVKNTTKKDKAHAG